MDLVKATKISKVAVKKSDLDSIQFNFQILNDGLVADLTDATVQLAVKKPSLLTVFEDCIITNATNGECELVLSNQSYLEVGTHIGELYVTQGAELAISNSFEYSSLDAILTDTSLQSTNDWQGIHDILLQNEVRPILGENDPNGIVPSSYKGQFFFDTLNNSMYFSTVESVNDSWLLLGGGVGGGEGGGVVQWNDILLKPNSFTPSAHEHAITEITGLMDALNSKLQAIPAEYLTESEGDLKYAPIGSVGSGDIGEVTWESVTGKPTTFTPSTHTHTKANITDFTHTHAISDVTNLQNTLNSKADDADLTPLITKVEADGKYELKGAGGKMPLQVTSTPTTTPEFIGQTAIDTTNKRTYIAEGLTTGDWRRLTGQNYVDLADSVIVNTTLGGLKFVQLTQSAYDALGTKNATTIYFISG